MHLPPTWLLSILTILGYVALYVIGGRPGGRWFKRLFAPLWLTIGLLLTSVNWLTLLAAPVWFLETQIPRGKDTLTDKIFWRIVWAIVYSLGAFLLGIISHNVLICLYQFMLCFSASLFFGIINPFGSWGEKGAMLTEGLIILSASVFLPFILS